VKVCSNRGWDHTDDSGADVDLIQVVEGAEVVERVSERFAEANEESIPIVRIENMECAGGCVREIELVPVFPDHRIACVNGQIVR
jgi:hypothetical protein